MLAIHGDDTIGQMPASDAIKELGITYPVAHDPKKTVWATFNIRFRPAHVILRPDGEIDDQGVGAVATRATEARFARLLPQ